MAGTTKICSNFKKWCPLSSDADSLLFKFGIKICTSLYEEQDFSFFPAQRRLKDFGNYIKPQRGINKAIIDELVEKTKNFTSPERNIVLTFDEMKIQYGLVWDTHSGDVIGYVDLGDVEVNYATVENTEEIVSNVLLFLIRGIINPFKFSLANFATTNVTAVQFHCSGKLLGF